MGQLIILCVPRVSFQSHNKRRGCQAEGIRVDMIIMKCVTGHLTIVLPLVWCWTNSEQQVRVGQLLVLWEETYSLNFEFITITVCSFIYLYLSFYAGGRNTIIQMLLNVKNTAT